jgi:hypothetical protein
LSVEGSHLALAVTPESQVLVTGTPAADFPPSQSLSKLLGEMLGEL